MTSQTMVLLLILFILAAGWAIHVECLKKKLKRLTTEFYDWKDNALIWDHHRQKVIDEWREAWGEAQDNRRDRLYSILKDCPRCSRKVK